ncbi:MAG: LacI family DNA-binding transcriptional regulator [Acidimicrobiia bacterium]
MTKVTIREVAAAAGVSVATVSRALRGLPSVSPATRAKVEQVAEELQYVPDPYAARLGTVGGQTVLVAVPVPGQWFYAQVVTGVEAMVSERGYDLQLHVVGDDAQRRHFIEDILPGQRRIDGVILVDIPLSEEEATALAGRGVRLVSVGQRVPGIHSVRIDNRRAGREATEQLLGMGHRRIGLLGGMPQGRSELSIPGMREIGYRDALVEAGVGVDEALVVNGNFSIDGGDEAARELLALPDPPTAIFALSDEMAVGAMRAARELGVVVPGELCILGFDGHDFAAAVGLSTVRQPVVEQGEAAAEALIAAIEGQPPDDADVVLAHEIVLRDTTRCAT